MICYDCSRDSVTNDAVAVCSVCLREFCRKHAIETDRAVTVTRLINRIETLPKRARSLLCQQCSEAMRQTPYGLITDLELRLR